MRTMTVKRLLLPDRVRKIEGSFSWIDHRFVTEGFLHDLSMIEILLYLFLVAVSDRNGLSFYHDDRIASLLKIDLPALGRAQGWFGETFSCRLRFPALSGSFLAFQAGAVSIQTRAGQARTTSRSLPFPKDQGDAEMKIDTWASIRHLFFVEKLPKKVIARKLGLDPKTVRRALKKETFSTVSSHDRVSKLDPFKDKIQALLETHPGLSGVRIHQEIQPVGYSGGISILRDYLRTMRTVSQGVSSHSHPTGGRGPGRLGLCRPNLLPRESTASSWSFPSAACSMSNSFPLSALKTS